LKEAIAKFFRAGEDVDPPTDSRKARIVAIEKRMIAMSSLEEEIGASRPLTIVCMRGVRASSST